jgi:biotin synthase-like enzyme
MKMQEKTKEINPVILKFELLTQGLEVAEDSREALTKDTKTEYAIGATGKAFLDLILKPAKIYVGVPIGGVFAEIITQNTPFLLKKIGDRWFVTKRETEIDAAGKEICWNPGNPGKVLMEVELFPRPLYYDLRTSRNLFMGKIMPATGDFAGATIDPRCDFWGHFDERLRGFECRYCGIGVNIEQGRDIEKKAPEDFVETLGEARKFKFFRHGPVFAGGAYPRPDRGHHIHARYLKALREAFPDNWLRLTICPPDDEKEIDLLFAAGANLVGYNYEIYDQELYRKLCPGKFHFINRGDGHANYDQVLSYGVKKFGPGSVHANLLVGLEPVESTVQGIEHLASMGVIPTVFVFHPLKGTGLANQPTASVLDLIYIYRQLKKITEKFQVDTACAGCHRMMVNTKPFDGIIPFMPEITDQDIENCGLPSSEVKTPWRRKFGIHLQEPPSASLPGDIRH